MVCLCLGRCPKLPPRASSYLQARSWCVAGRTSYHPSHSSWALVLCSSKLLWHACHELFYARMRAEVCHYSLKGGGNTRKAGRQDGFALACSHWWHLANTSRQGRVISKLRPRPSSIHAQTLQLNANYDGNGQLFCCLPTSTCTMQGH